MQKITPFLWFNDNAEQAMEHYVATFGNSKVLSVSRYGDGGPGPKGQAMSCEFQLEGQRFLALNGGPHYKLTEAFSLLVSCETQAEIDALCDRLTSGGGEVGRCGWLKDRFGLSWQLVPPILGRLLSDKDPAKSGRVMRAMMGMKKLDIAALERAAEG